MDYLIELQSLNSKKTEMESLKTDSENIYNEFNSGYLNKLSGTEIASLTSTIKQGIERQKKGVTNSNTWYNKYLSELETLEDELASFSGSSLGTPTEFAGEFVDLFGKKTMPVLKTDGDVHALATTVGVAGEGLTVVEVNGEKYLVADTDGELLEYYNSMIRSKGLYQEYDYDSYRDQCLGFAYNYAYGLYTNDRNIKGSTCRNNTSYGNNFKEYTTDSESAYLQKIYEEISAGRPVVVQVIGSRSRKSRHYVTAVGFKDTVTSASDLKPTDLLIMDTYDGKIKEVVPYGAGSGRYIASGYQINKGRYNYGYDMFYINNI